MIKESAKYFVKLKILTTIFCSVESSVVLLRYEDYSCKGLSHPWK